ncbi:MAG: hypothetical protein KGZ74_19030 [Chitinophagaceae bacterium]|nr:hypothetical protein [Chitinophagaceae bacterium]
MSFSLFTTACTVQKTGNYNVKGIVFGQPVDLSVDNILAKQMIEDSTKFDYQNIDKELSKPRITTNFLISLTKKYSIDVATVYFLQKTYSENKDFYSSYSNTLAQLSKGESPPELEKLKGYTFLFVPGLAYKADTSTGADFARQRRLLDHYGVKNRLINTAEWGLCDDNAKIVADEIKKEKGRAIVLVSASKGSIEAYIALNDLLDSNEIKKVHSWISVGGILNGSPIADKYTKFPYSWFAKIVLVLNRINNAVIKDLSYKSRTRDLRKNQLPANLKIIHFVGVPFSLQLSADVKGPYKHIKKLGPNDGLTPIADQLLPGGIVICEIGLDHYFRSVTIDLKTLALGCLAVSN